MYYINLCLAPCIRKDEEYIERVNRIEAFLRGEGDQLIQKLREEMKASAEKRKFELAMLIREQIEALKFFSEQQNLEFYEQDEAFRNYIEDKNLLASTSLSALMEELNLQSIPNVIECFDVSHLSGTALVGAMVQFRNGKANKTNYRRFKIKTVDGNDDFASIAEIVKRRYARLKREGEEMPDLIVIDGGRGQLSAAGSVLQELGVNIPLIALAKKFEEIYLKGSPSPLRLSENSPALKLLMQIRDEAHRFAIKYHRLLRSKNMLEEGK
jgi:excinuclease ABC subunit C